MSIPEIHLTVPVGPADRPLLVLGHSLGTGPLIWEDTLSELASEYRVSLLTLPGHGEAPTPRAPFSMTDLGDAVAGVTRDIAAGAPAFYAGVSIGGALALQLALDHPSTFGAVASIAAGAELGSREHWQSRAQLVRDQSTSVLIAPSSQSWFAPASFAERPELIGRVLHALRDTSSEGYARCAEALGGYDVRDRLAEIRVPVLAAWGEHDTVAPEDKQAVITAAVPGALSVRIDGAAHQPPVERPRRTTEALLGFFSTVTKQRVSV